MHSVQHVSIFANGSGAWHWCTLSDLVETVSTIASARKQLSASAFRPGIRVIEWVVPVFLNLVLELQVFPLAVEVLHPLARTMGFIQGLHFCAAFGILSVAVKALPVAISRIPTLLTLFLVRKGHRGFLRA